MCKCIIYELITMEYDTALKKLINILKFKHTDGLKQIEDLWDSINTATKVTKTSDDVTENNLVKTNVKRAAADLLQTNSKKQKLIASTKPSHQQNKTKPNNDEDELSQNDEHNKQAVMCVDDDKSNNSCSNDKQTKNTSPEVSKVDDYAIDMGPTCDICL